MFTITSPVCFHSNVFLSALTFYINMNTAFIFSLTASMEVAILKLWKILKTFTPAIFIAFVLTLLYRYFPKKVVRIKARINTRIRVMEITTGDACTASASRLNRAGNR